MLVRQFREADKPTLCALNALPNIGNTADPTVPLPLTPATGPANFPDLNDIRGHYLDAGGDFLVVELDGHLVGMGGIRPDGTGNAEVLRIRVHPAVRRRGVGRALMAALEVRAAQLGLRRMYLDTATNMPEAVAFYRGLGYEEVARETQPTWWWTLIYFAKPL